MNLAEYLKTHADTLRDAKTHRNAWASLINEARGWAGSKPAGESDSYRAYCDHEREALLRLLNVIVGLPGTGPNGHTLYQTSDSDTPDTICDSNGEVVLGLCRVCGKGEIELDEPCKPVDPAPEDFSPSLTTIYAIKKHGLDAVIEMAIFERVVRAAIAQGCKVTLQDGLSAADGAEEVVVDSTDLLEIVRAARTTEADVIRLSGPIRGWIAFVWGNGAEVIADHTAGDAMAAFVDSFDRVIEKLA